MSCFPSGGSGRARLCTTGSLDLHWAIAIALATGLQLWLLRPGIALAWLWKMRFWIGSTLGVATLVLTLASTSCRPEQADEGDVWKGSEDSQTYLGVSSWRASRKNDHDMHLEGLDASGQPTLSLHARRDGTTWIVEGDADGPYRFEVGAGGSHMGSIPAIASAALPASLHDRMVSRAAEVAQPSIGEASADLQATRLGPRTTYAQGAEPLLTGAPACVIKDETDTLIFQFISLLDVCEKTDGTVAPTRLCRARISDQRSMKEPPSWMRNPKIAAIFGKGGEDSWGVPQGSRCDAVAKNLIDKATTERGEAAVGCALDHLLTDEPPSAAVDVEPKTVACAGKNLHLSFSKCSPDQAADIAKLHCNALERVNHNVASIDALASRFTREPNARDPWFGLWFYHEPEAALSVEAVAAARTALTKTRDGLAGPTTYVCHPKGQTCDDGTGAFVDPGENVSKGGKVTLCPAYFEQDSELRPHILVHELTHAFADTRDRGYGDFSIYRTACDDRVVLSTELLLQNADTIAGYGIATEATKKSILGNLGPGGFQRDDLAGSKYGPPRTL